MRRLFLAFGIGLGIVSVCVFCFAQGMKAERRHTAYPFVIDLPEEYPGISNNADKPTPMKAFFDNDTLYIQFAHIYNQNT
jgi:hypothetical protein